MHRRKILRLIPLLACPAARGEPRTFSGAAALRHACRAASFGPRPPGSAALARLRAYLREHLQQYGWRVVADPFQAQTPLGAIYMENLIALRAGSRDQVLVVTGHYDTKWLPQIRFVGANDGGSSTGLLLELARVLPAMGLRSEVRLVFFDGEESFGPWSETDGLYGSRHLAARWAKEGLLARLRALINVDMIGDRDLGICQEMNSTEWLRTLAWQTASELGLGRYFLHKPAWVEDDHVPFLRRGASALNLIDFDYGPANSYWHTEQDTCDKLSAASFDAVGRVVLALLKKLD